MDNERSAIDTIRRPPYKYCSSMKPFITTATMSAGGHGPGGTRPISTPRKILPLGNPPPQNAMMASSSSTSAPGGKQVLRVNRACNACRKQKMRCEGPDNPPCARCKAQGQPCVFEKVQKQEASDANSQRINDLEGKWSNIEGTLSDVLEELRDVKNRLGRPSDQAVSFGHPAALESPSTRVTPFSPALSLSMPSPSGTGLFHLRRPSGSGSRHSERAMSTTSIASPSARRRTLPSDIYSADISGDEEDLPSAALAAPISVVNDIAAGQPQAADDDSSSSFSDDEVTMEQSRRRRMSASPTRIGGAEKRKRRESSVTDRARARGATARGVPDTDVNMTSLPSPNPSLARPRRRRTRDVVAKGLLTEADAMQLYKNYFSGCHRLLAVFDSRVDTYQSLKERSPFLFSALLMVGAKVQDGPIVSEVQSMLLHEATEHAKDRVFDSKGRVEDVQALLLLAGWSHSMGGVGWLTAGHAIRVAVELGLHKALPRLEKAMNTGENADSENHRPLITAARTWLALYVFEYQISFGTGRPAMMQGDAAITKAKDVLLSHPLSIATDARLVSTCDLLTRQSAIHERLQRSEVQADDKRIFQTLQEATGDIDAWLEEWDAHMSRSQPTAGFFRSSAAIQRAYAHLFHNCIALRGLKTIEDAKALSPEMRSIALRAIQSAKECVNICLNNQEYRDGLRYAVAYTHTCAAFAGAFLLRFARLFRSDLDLGETTELVGALADVLSEVPAVSLGVWLRKLLDHTKEKAAHAEGDLSYRANPITIGFLVEPTMASRASNAGIGSSAVPLPPPPAQLPNAHRFMPVGTSSSTAPPPDAPYIEHELAAMPGAAPFGGDASSILQGFLGDLGDGNDWPPWLTTSVVGDLDSNLSFTWNP